MNNRLITVGKNCDEAVEWTEQQLAQAGLQVIRTFDLQQASLPHAACACQDHGTHACDCQMVVLLVYGPGPAPVSLVAHSYNGQTSFSLVGAPQAGQERTLSTQIQDVLALV